MQKETDFKIDGEYFYFKKASYPLSKINDVQLKKLSLIDNLGQIIFWLFIFSGAVWLAIPDIKAAPLWLLTLATVLSVVGFIFAMFRCSRFALQIKFKHIDETGIQWINVAKSSSVQDKQVFEKQVNILKGKFE